MSKQNDFDPGQVPAQGSSPAEPPPMTRRERREREAREAAGQGATPAAPPAPSAPEVAPEVSSGAASTETVPSPVVPAAPPEQAAPAQPMTRRERREMEARERAGEAGAVVESVPVSHADQSTTEETTDTSPTGVSEPLAPASSPEETRDVAAVKPLPPVFEPATVQLSANIPLVTDGSDDEDAEMAESRQVSVGDPTTHALVLPAIPSVDMTGPIGDTGEVIATGQISLPLIVTEHGMQGHFDEDEGFDQMIGAETTSLTAPISAVSAVSSKGDDSEFQMVRKAPWGTAATALAASAVLLVLAAAGLMAAALLTDVLSWPF